METEDAAKHAKVLTKSDPEHDSALGLTGPASCWPFLSESDNSELIGSTRDQTKHWDDHA